MLIIFVSRFATARWLNVDNPTGWKKRSCQGALTLTTTLTKTEALTLPLPNPDPNGNVGATVLAFRHFKGNADLI